MCQSQRHLCKTYSNLNAIEIASYALCAILTTTKEEKDTWEKDIDSLKENFDDCMKILTTYGSETVF